MDVLLREHQQRIQTGTTQQEFMISFVYRNSLYSDHPYSLHSFSSSEQKSSSHNLQPAPLSSFTPRQHSAIPEHSRLHPHSSTSSVTRLTLSSLRSHQVWVPSLPLGTIKRQAECVSTTASIIRSATTSASKYTASAGIFSTN